MEMAAACHQRFSMEAQAAAKGWSEMDEKSPTPPCHWPQAEKPFQWRGSLLAFQSHNGPGIGNG